MSNNINVYIKAKSLTVAQNMKRCLESAQIKSSITRIKSGQSGSGCGYAIRIRGQNGGAARRALEAWGLPAQISDERREAAT